MEFLKGGVDGNGHIFGVEFDGGHLRLFIDVGTSSVLNDMSMNGRALMFLAQGICIRRPEDHDDDWTRIR